MSKWLLLPFLLSVFFSGELVFSTEDPLKNPQPIEVNQQGNKVEKETPSAKPEAAEDQAEEAPQPEAVEDQAEEAPQPEAAEDQAEEAPQPEAAEDQAEEAPQPEAVEDQAEEAPQPEAVEDQAEEAPQPEAVEDQAEEAPQPEAVEDQAEEVTPSAQPKPEVVEEKFEAKSAEVPAPAIVTRPLAERDVPPEEALRRFNIMQGRIGEHHRPTPLGELPEGALELSAPPTVGATSVETTARSTAGAIEILNSHVLSDLETSDSTSTVAEPSVATRGQEVLITGNWFAAFSDDAGNSFTYINPDTTFPQIPNQPFCCDQVALYDPNRDTMFWFMQHSRDSNGNTIRLAVARGDDIADRQWRYYDFTPQGVGNWDKEWFDYPDLALGEEYLYITTNAFRVTGGFTRSVILRLPLDELSAYEGFNFDFFDTQSLGSLRPTQGGTDVMYFGTHKNANTVRVFSWPENTTSVSSNDVSVDLWSRGTSVAPGPEGNDWLGRTDPRITAAWLSGEQIGFAWTVAQDANFPFPQVRVALLDKTTKAIVSQPHIWNPNYAFAYPAAAPNRSGVVGLSLFYGGGLEVFPSHAIGILNDEMSWEMIVAARGNKGPSVNKWGDYLSVRQHGQDDTDNTWVATGFFLQDGTNRRDIKINYVHFGQVEAPPPPPPEIDIDAVLEELNLLENGINELGKYIEEARKKLGK